MDYLVLQNENVNELCMVAILLRFYTQGRYLRFTKFGIDANASIAKFYLYNT